jgi:hypothetical protein
VNKRTKIILAVPLILISYFGISDHLRQQRNTANDRKTYDEQLAFYAVFLTPGMKRADVERELNRRSIAFSQRYEKRAWEDFVLLERFTSPHWFCKFEYATVRFEFDSGGTFSRSGEPAPDDRLRKTSVSRQLVDCL